jgi:hypothetical protein
MPKSAFGLRGREFWMHERARHARCFMEPSDIESVDARNEGRDKFDRALGPLDERRDEIRGLAGRSGNEEALARREARHKGGRCSLARHCACLTLAGSAS